MKTLRTPDERFTGLPGFNFAPNYVEIADSDGGTLRVHYLREGDPDASVVLLMHGEPSWCYLYRKMIPVLTGAGLQVIAPDLVGFGRSDKPSERGDYTFARHVEWVRDLLFDQLHLRGVTLVCQDWGGLIGLRLVGEHPERFARVVAANTFLPTGDTNPGDAFFSWQRSIDSLKKTLFKPVFNSARIASVALSRPCTAAYRSRTCQRNLRLAS